jgi:nucleotide-binding universal stress UspA family protein
MLNIHRILHPTDSSPNGQRVFEVAAGLARDYNAKLIVLGVVVPPIQMGAFAGFGAELTDARREMEAILADIEPMEAGVAIERVVVEGESAGEQIVRFAQDHECDLIVMGTHGRTGIQRLILGSVAQEVTRKAPCPVLLIRDASRLLGGKSAVTKGQQVDG